MELSATAVGPEFLILYVGYVYPKVYVEGFQDRNRFQKDLNYFMEERAHRGTTQSCLDAFFSIQSTQVVVDCLSCNGADREGSLFFGLSPDCLH